MRSAPETRPTLDEFVRALIVSITALRLETTLACRSLTWFVTAATVGGGGREGERERKGGREKGGLGWRGVA